MPHDHLIKLRGGWERSGTDGPAQRVTLPLAEALEGSRRVRLSRRFQAPRLDPARESLWLRLDAVPGLVSVVLNDREIACKPFPEPSLFLSLAEVMATGNRLILDVELPEPATGFPWGEVALVVRSGDSG